MTDSLLHRTETLERAQRLLNSKASRTILGIVGKPGSGKSTLAQFLLDQLPEGQVALVPMDGFHLSNEVGPLKGLGGSNPLVSANVSVNPSSFN